MLYEKVTKQLTILILSTTIVLTNSCATERVIYKTEYIKPSILPLRIFQRPATDKICSYNVDNLTILVEAYESEIKIFNESLKELDK